MTQDTVTKRVNVVTSALPSGAATAANQLPDGHNVAVASLAHAKTIVHASGNHALTSEVAIIAAAGASLKNKVYSVSFTMAKATATSCIVQLLNGSGGSQIWGATLRQGADGMAGAVQTVSIPSWFAQSSDNTAIYLKLSAAETVYYNVSCFQEA